MPSALPANVTCSSQLWEYEFKLHKAQMFEALEELRQALWLHTYMFINISQGRGWIHTIRTFLSGFTRGWMLPRLSITQHIKHWSSCDPSGRCWMDGKTASTQWWGCLATEGSGAGYTEEEEEETDRKEEGGGINWTLMDMEDCRGFEWWSGWGSTERWVWISFFIHELIWGACFTLWIEWCWVWARSMWWSEEVLLLGEEMHWVLAYFMCHAGWWLDHTEMDWSMLSNTIQEGVAAYAYKQSHMCKTLRSKFDSLWWASPELASMSVGADNAILDLGMATSIVILP